MMRFGSARSDASLEARQARDGATGWDRMFVCAATNVCLADVIVGAGGIFAQNWQRKGVDGWKTADAVIENWMELLELAFTERGRYAATECTRTADFRPAWSWRGSMAGFRRSIAGSSSVRWQAWPCKPIDCQIFISPWLVYISFFFFLSYFLLSSL